MRKINPTLAPQLAKLVQRAVAARAEASGRPFLLYHMVTNRCMCSCASCLWKRNDWEDVPPAELKRFYAEAREQGFLGVAISGGEPFLRQDLGELTRFVKEQAEMPILQFTSGWFLEDRAAEVLPNVAMLCLSLDSAKPERHDQIRGLPGLWRRLMRAVELVKRDYPQLSVQFNTCVQKGMADEIDDLIRLAEDTEMQISFDVITDYRHGEGEAHFTETGMGLPLVELRGVCGYLLERKRAGAPIINSELYFKYFMDGKPGYRCHFPKLLMCVDGRGEVEDCLNLHRNIANIRTTPLKEILELPRFKQLRQDAEDCCSCSSPTMVDLSNLWQDPKLLFQPGGIEVG